MEAEHAEFDQKAIRSLLVPHLAHWQTDSHKEDSVLHKEGLQSWTG